MKRNWFALTCSALSLILVSCGGLSKENKSSRSNLDGTWMLQDVTYGSEGYFKSVLFNDVDAKCFKGSEWFFRSNNSTGSYTINDTNCSTGTRNIRWSITDTDGTPSQFQFKFVDEKKKDLNNGMGYVFRIVSMSPSTMTLASSVSVDGKPVELIYNFNKTAELK